MEQQQSFLNAVDQELVTRFLKDHRAEDPEGKAANWRLLLTAEEIDTLNDYLAYEINKRFLGQQIVVTTILKGAVYFCVDLTRRLTVPHSLYFIEVSSYKDTQTQCEKVELLSKIVPKKFNGKKVILIDELYDNGATLAKVKAKLLSTEGITITEKDVFTCTLFAKNKKTSYPSPDLVGFPTLPDLWIVGYGLDDCQEKRSWKHLFALPRTSGPTNDCDKALEQTPEGNKAYFRLRQSIINEINLIRTKMVSNRFEAWEMQRDIDEAISK